MPTLRFMMRSLFKLLQRRLFWLSLLLMVWLLCSGGQAQAGPLTDRLQQFPDWSGKPPLQHAQGDLAYPAWMAGSWRMTTTLVDLASPLAPDIVTPGFEGNREFLNQVMESQVRFVPDQEPAKGPLSFFKRSSTAEAAQIVADRAFNGLNLAKTYLGDNVVKAVKVDPENPNRQVTILSSERQLESIVTERATEAPAEDTFVTSEVFQQIFRGVAQPYFNEVETTTAYHRLEGDGPAIEADQVTAIYLSPQDPDYFKAINKPVALYRYRLEFFLQKRVRNSARDAIR
ncbi:MAG TPA: hypothetical protein V6D07_03925 [Trichocoleus sp.]